MSAKFHVKALLEKEDGAVTVDWVVLSASIIGIGLLVLGPIAISADNATDDVSAYVEGVPVGYGN
jgi:hypothetical protein